MFKKPLFKRVLLVVIALAIGGYSTFQLKTFLERNRPTEQVLVARRDIMPQSVITPGDIGFADLPAGSRIPGSLQDPKEVVGKKAVMTIFKNEQILPQKLTDASLALGPGEAQVGLPADTVDAVGMTIKPGDIVDVYWQPPAEKGLPSSQDQPAVQQAREIAEHAVVIDLVNKNNTSAYGAAPAPPEERRQGTVDDTPSVVVLKVKNDYVQAVATAVGNGRIYLVKKGG
ncbi:Flp pilus assembly protein CpaB [Desulfofundulus sp.]|uniref:Flp pilus assembly protein CpaB n=1 Tax=Desulfofundulus sp. TaxID=2282750 RepID=UPI003C765EB8